MTELNRRRGMYFEEFEVGQRIATPARTVTEADIVNFAGLSGDFNALHTDAVFGQGTAFGQRVAHGLLGMAIVSGLAGRTGIIEGTALAFREINEWKFSQPVFIGDTIHAELEIREVRPMARLNGGAVVLGVEVINQAGTKVMGGAWTVLMQSRPVEG